MVLAGAKPGQTLFSRSMDIVPDAVCCDREMMLCWFRIIIKRCNDRLDQTDTIPSFQNTNTLTGISSWLAVRGSTHRTTITTTKPPPLEATLMKRMLASPDLDAKTGRKKPAANTTSLVRKGESRYRLQVQSLRNLGHRIVVIFDFFPKDDRHGDHRHLPKRHRIGTGHAPLANLRIGHQQRIQLLVTNAKVIFIRPSVGTPLEGRLVRNEGRPDDRVGTSRGLGRSHREDEASFPSVDDAGQ